MNTVLKQVAEELVEFEVSAQLNAEGEPYDRFADLLVDQAKLGDIDLKRALRFVAQAENESLPTMLVKLGLVAERDVADALVEVSGLAFVSSDNYAETSRLHYRYRTIIRHRLLSIYHKQDLRR